MYLVDYLAEKRFLSAIGVKKLKKLQTRTVYLHLKERVAVSINACNLGANDQIQSKWIS